MRLARHPARAGPGDGPVSDVRQSSASKWRSTGVNGVDVGGRERNSLPPVTRTTHPEAMPMQPRGTGEPLAARRVASGRTTVETSVDPDGEDASKSLNYMEASAGIEPAYTDLQSAA